MRQQTINFADLDYLKCQIDCGVQGEHRATQLKFMTSLEDPDEKTYKLVFEPGGVSQTLNAVNGEIFYEIPQSVSLLKNVKATLEAYEGDLRIYKSPVIEFCFAPSAHAEDPVKEEQESFRQEVAHLSDKINSKISELSNNSCNPLLQKVNRSTADIIELSDVSPQDHLINAKIYKKNLITYPYKDGTSKTTNGIKFSVNSDGTIRVTGTGLPIKNYATFYLTDNIVFLDGEKYSLSERTVVSFRHNGITKYFGSWNSPFVWHEAYKKPCVYAEIPKGDSVLISTIKPQVEFGEISTEYEKGLEASDIKINVYDNIDTKTEYKVSSHGLAHINSISPKMKIDVSNKTLNIAFSYQRDINDGIKNNNILDPTATGDYEKLKNLPKVNGKELKGNLTITKETLGVKDGAQGETGAQGLKGDTGDRGADGISPTISLEPIEGGNRATVTDVNGTSTFDILNGAKGDKGADGVNGKDGVSPSVDEVTQSVLASLPTWTGGAF